MHATAIFRVAAKLLTIASWTPSARQTAIVREAVAMLEARAGMPYSSASSMSTGWFTWT